MTLCSTRPPCGPGPKFCPNGRQPENKWLLSPSLLSLYLPGDHPTGIMLLFVCLVIVAWVKLPAEARPTGARLGIYPDQEEIAFEGRSCTVDELLPGTIPKDISISPEWSENTTKPVYGCDCSYTRARYGTSHVAAFRCVSPVFYLILVPIHAGPRQGWHGSCSLRRHR